MRNSCAVCALAVALCLVICVSANGKVSVQDATAAVAAAKKSVTEVRVKAQNALDNAQSLLDKVASSKNKAEAAASKSQTAATDNTEAVELAKTIRRLSDEVAASYPAGQQQLDTAVKSLTLLLADAKRLEAEPEITITPNGDQGDDYTETKGKATTLQGQATTLDGKINAAVEPIAGVDTTVNTMEQKAKNAQLKDAHVSAIVAVAKIKIMLASADNIILQIEEKKDEVSGIVDQMQTLQRNAPTVSDDNIKALHTNAANALTAATGAFDNAKRDKTDIQTQKGLADAALAGVKAEKNDVSKAEGEVRKAEACVTAAQLIIQKLNSKLQTAETSATNAKPLKKKLMTALSTTTSAPTPEEVKETEKANPPVEQRTEPDQKDTTIKPTSKDSLAQSNNSTDILKDTLIKEAQNVPTTALTGGKAPAPGAKNDSAMTVSVPLLVALIASAVLQ